MDETEEMDCGRVIRSADMSPQLSEAWSAYEKNVRFLLELFDLFHFLAPCC